MNINLWIALGCGLVFFAIAMLLRQRKIKKANNALNNRESLTDEDIYMRFFASKGLEQSSVHELWHEIASILAVPPEKLRPTDLFGKDVGAFFITSEELDSLSQRASMRAKIQGRELNLSNIKTIGEYVEAFAGKRL
jgi:hypothetical protein